MSYTIGEYLTQRFSEYSDDGAEFYFSQGSYRGFLDAQSGSVLDNTSPSDVIEIYDNDWRNGYDAGVKAFKDSLEEPEF